MMRKLLVLLALLTVLCSLSGCKKQEPIADIVEQCALSFAKAYLINNFEYNPSTKYYISERLKGFSQQQKSKTVQFPCYYFVYDMENILFCIGVYSSEKNDTGTITYPYMGKFVYALLVDKTTEMVLKEKNLYADKIKINKEINLSKINKITVNECFSTEETSLIIKDMLIEVANRKIKGLEYTEEDKFYIKNPIRDYTIVVEDEKNICINEKLIYPLFMNNEIIALFEFHPNGSIASTKKVDQNSIYTKAYQTSDKFVLVHGGDYPYLKTYCLYGDETLDAEVLAEMLKDPIFIKSKAKIDQILSNLQPYGLMIELEISGI